jgi:hypothetical protein
MLATRAPLPLLVLLPLLAPHAGAAGAGGGHE